MKNKLLVICCVLLIFSLFGCKVKPETENDVAAILSPNTEKKDDDVAENEQTGQPQKEQSESTDDKVGDTIEQSESDINEIEKETEQAIPIDKEEPQQDEVSKEDGEIIRGDTHYQTGNVTDPFTLLENSVSDVFIGTILETKMVREPFEVPGYVGFEKGAMIYKIQIEKVYRGTCVTNNTVVYLYNSLLIDDHAYSLDENDYAKTNEKYIFNAIVKPVNNEPILVGLNIFNPKIETDGKLTSISFNTAVGLEKISTLEKFDKSQRLNKIWGAEFKYLHDVFTRYIKTDKTEQELIADLKKAIIADSDFKMNLNTNK